MRHCRLFDASGRLTATLEIADTPLRAARGLSFRRRQDPSGGMWFPGVRSIHMLGMRWPIDVLFVGRPDDENRREVYKVVRHLAPWTGLAACREADGCIELAADAAAAITVGDRISLQS